VKIRVSASRLVTRQNHLACSWESCHHQTIKLPLSPLYPAFHYGLLYRTTRFLCQDGDKLDWWICWRTKFKVGSLQIFLIFRYSLECRPSALCVSSQTAISFDPQFAKLPTQPWRLSCTDQLAMSNRRTSETQNYPTYRCDPSSSLSLQSAVRICISVKVMLRLALQARS